MSGLACACMGGRELESIHTIIGGLDFMFIPKRKGSGTL